MEKKKIAFKTYIEAIERGPTDLRLFLFNIFADAPELRDDFQWPTIMDGFVKTLPFMFFGGQNSITPLHFDIDCPSNFLTQFHTQKKVLLFNRDQSKYLYHQPFTVQSQVDLQILIILNFRPYVKPRNRGYHWHGDTVYIPPHWWHYIEYLDSGFSLALRAHASMTNKFVAVRNLVQHLYRQSMNRIMGEKWKTGSWKQPNTGRRHLKGLKIRYGTTIHFKRTWRNYHQVSN